MNRKKLLFPLVVLVLAIVAGCGSTSAADNAQQQSGKLQSKVYKIKNFVEFRNYNWRQQVSDDPSTILWCTFFTYDAKPFTVPIAGKLTSSDKRPYDINNGDGTEIAGPDSMFGSSVGYRYGFGPLGIADYIDFTDTPSVCTTIPKVWQAQTDIVATTSTTLNSLTLAAEAALRKGDAKGAAAILAKAGSSK